MQIHFYSNIVSSGDDLDCFLKVQRDRSYASYVMKEESQYVALSLVTKAPVTTCFAIASFVEDG